MEAMMKRKNKTEKKDTVKKKTKKNKKVVDKHETL